MASSIRWPTTTRARGRSAVVLGAGGAARAAVVAARRLGYEVSVSARRDAEADRLADAMGSIRSPGPTSRRARPTSTSTPRRSAGGRGSAGDSPEPPASRPLVFDCVYRRDGRETSTIRAARAARCPTVEGLQMFAAQAVRQAQLFGLDDVTLAEVVEILRDGFAETRGGASGVPGARPAGPARARRARVRRRTR